MQILELVTGCSVVYSDRSLSITVNIILEGSSQRITKSIMKTNPSCFKILEEQNISSRENINPNVGGVTSTAQLVSPNSKDLYFTVCVKELVNKRMRKTTTFFVHRPNHGEIATFGILNLPYKTNDRFTNRRLRLFSGKIEKIDRERVELATGISTKKLTVDDDWEKDIFNKEMLRPADKPLPTIEERLVTLGDGTEVGLKKVKNQSRKILF